MTDALPPASEVATTVPLNEYAPLASPVPVPVKVGDIVEYGFRDAFAVKHHDYTHGERLLVIWSKNIYGLAERDAHTGLLEQTSAAIDA